MEVGVRGGVYNVSNVDGVPKISPKSQATTSGDILSKTVITMVLIRMMKITVIIIIIIIMMIVVIILIQMMIG